MALAVCGWFWRAGTAAAYPYVATGQDHSCGVTGDGTLWCWGRNDHGELGDGTKVGRLRPVKVAASFGNAFVSAGEQVTCAVPTGFGAQHVWCWGWGGLVGDGTSVDRTSPVDIMSTNDSWDGAPGDVSVGNAHTCARKGGQVFCWGSDAQGQLGDGQANLTPVPGPVLAAMLGDTVGGIAAGVHTCAIVSGGNVLCFGGNAYGQLGDGTTIDRATPVQPHGLGGSVVQIATGQAHTCALKSDGTLWCWGDNTGGQLGDGTFTARLTPVQVTALGNTVQKIATGGFHTCVIKNDGTPWCWGDNESGQVGDGTFTTRTLPVPITPPASPFVEISGGEYHTCARAIDNSIWCWGDNEYGKLGDGTTTNRASPTLVNMSAPAPGPAVPASRGWSVAALFTICAAIAALRLRTRAQSNSAR
jgi:alpha-tubulin suppressor-like RCC1 family protein